MLSAKWRRLAGLIAQRHGARRVSVHHPRPADQVGPADRPHARTLHPPAGDGRRPAGRRRGAVHRPTDRAPRARAALRVRRAAAAGPVAPDGTAAAA